MQKTKPYIEHILADSSKLDLVYLKLQTHAISEHSSDDYQLQALYNKLKK